MTKIMKVYYKIIKKEKSERKPGNFPQETGHEQRIFFVASKKKEKETCATTKLHISALRLR